MLHRFKCDGCGDDVEARCFQKHQTVFHVYDPPLPPDMPPGERLVAMATRVVKNYCRDCYAVRV